MEWLQQAGVNDEGAMVSLDDVAAAGSGKRGLFFCGRCIAGTDCTSSGIQCASCKRYQERREPMPSAAAGSRKAPARGDPPPWWNPEMPVPQGFKVQRQAETCTKGIEIYPRPFLLRRRGKQTAVLLMDSQGAFDGMINEKQSQTIFALTAGLASNVIYNFKGNIGEENLKHMTEVGQFVKTALSLTGKSEDGLRTPAEQRPLGSLSFMLRDFDYPYPDGRCDEEVTWEVRLGKAEEELARFEREAAVLSSSFRSVKMAWLSHPGQEVEQGRSCDLRFAKVQPLFMQLLDEFVWHTFERADAAFPFPSRSILDGVPLTVNNFMAHIENLRAMLFDCDLKMAPPRWMAMQLLKKERDDFQVDLEESMRLDLPRLEHIAAGGFGGYYTSDLDDFYTISKLVQIQDRVVATSEKCPGNPSTGTVKGNILHMQGGSGTLSGDEITWSSGEPHNCFLCVPPLEPQVWVRQALTKEQVATAEGELEGQREALQGADGELARLRGRAEQAVQDRIVNFQDKIAHLLQASEREQQGFVQDLRRGLGECLEARVLDGRATISRQEAEVANRRVDLAGQRERIAVLEAKMAKAELAHIRGEAPEKASRTPRNSSIGFPFCAGDWGGFWQSHCQVMPHQHLSA